MADYSNGKIYQICSLLTNKIYIGSTIRTLDNRFYSHKSDYKLYSEGNFIKQPSSFKMLKYCDCFIELVEDYPCQSRTELEIREGELQLQFIDVIVNKQIAGRTKKAYYEANKDELIKKNKAYYEANKDDILKHKKAYREANREDILKKKKAYYEANKEDIIKKTKAYYEANKL